MSLSLLLRLNLFYLILWETRLEALILTHYVVDVIIIITFLTAIVNIAIL